jgi:hypothetical protein
MAVITLPDELLQRLEESLPESVSAEAFVADAVREKLAFEGRKAEFYRLSDETRRLMLEKGHSETQILKDFDAFREGQARG